PLAAALAPPAREPSNHPARRGIVERVAATLIAREAELNALDARVGDGDTGSTFAAAARAVLADVDALPFADAPALCAAISGQLAKVMGGSSGILLSIAVAAMGTAVAAQGTGAPDWAASLRAGLSRIEQYGGAREGDRTMLDALWPAVRALEAGQGMKGAAVAARAGAEHTATLIRARAGRSSYVPDDALRGVPDPGAFAMAAVLEALAEL
ncbi:MAG: Dihydroxyacetone kinase, ATP-dependent, partial [Labilithrix sp.]|nr:Dihydroxyacetone kinase, ATP-dependent [Labilithrix sp.]